jgi:glycosyltransferase involved in cell wall biosynthesis
MQVKSALRPAQPMQENNIRILYISNPESIHAKRWLKAFADRGYDIHLLSPVPWEEDRVSTHVLPLYPIGAKNLWSRSLGGLQNVNRARKTIRELSPRIIHLHGLFTVAGPDLMFTVFRQHNLVVSAWGSDVVYPHPCREPFRSWAIKKFLFRQAAAVLATSEYQSRVTQQYCPKDLKVVSTPFGVDLDLFKRDHTVHKPQGVLTLGFVKRLEENYGPHILIEAFRLVQQKHKHTRLLVIGEGLMRKQLEEQLKQMGLLDKAVFAGWIENHRLPEYLNQMDIFVMPTFQETFGVAALEAQAVQVPVVASDIEGIREVVLHGKTGYLAHPGDPAQFADRIIKLIKDPQGRQRMGMEGRKFVSERYEWQQCVDRVERVYLSLLNEPGALAGLSPVR